MKTWLISTAVETKRLIEQVKRNLERFPEDFMSSSVRTRPRL